MPINEPPSTADTGAGLTFVKGPQRWLPRVDEKKDGLGAHLICFERFATGQRWPREHWATALSVCLAGGALGVFLRQALEALGEYDK